MTFNVQIFDNSREHIADKMDATPSEVITFLNKGFIVVNILTGQEMTIADAQSAIGVSESIVSIG